MKDVRRAKASKPGRGGARPGAGRPRVDRSSGINWTEVRKHFRLGGSRDDVLTALGLTSDQLSDPGITVRLQKEQEQGAALHRLDLLAGVDRLRKGGSVNATLASLKQKVGWDRHEGEKGNGRPDAEAAAAEIDALLTKLFRDKPRCPTCGSRTLHPNVDSGQEGVNLS
jgi:hypothetical protein